VGDVSIHISNWPRTIPKFEAGSVNGLLAADIVAAVRRYKGENKIALGAQIGPIRLITKEPGRLETSLEDIKGTVKSTDVTLEKSEDLSQEISGLKPVFKELGPKYRDRMKAIISTFKHPLKGEQLAVKMEKDGQITFDPHDGKGEVTLTSNMAEVQKRWVFQGREVNYLTVGDVIVVLEG
jgi:hypothetical protein